MAEFYLDERKSVVPGKASQPLNLILKTQQVIQDFQVVFFLCNIIVSANDLLVYCFQC